MSAIPGSYDGLLQAALVASLIFAVPVSAAAALAYGRVRRALRRVAPSMRATLLLLYAALPFMGAIAGLLAIFTPSLLNWVGLAADHCHLHPDHPHLCLFHPPQAGGEAISTALFLAAAALLLLRAAPWLLHWFQTRRTVARLLAVSRLDQTRGVHIVPTDAPLAFAAGLHAPRLFLSSRLLGQLSAGQVDVVIAHERAHAARHDALRQTLAAALSRLHTPATRRLLLADLALATEQACDEAACTATGDRLLVAEAIVKVEQLFAMQARQPSPLFAASHFTGSNVPERVQAMLAAPQAAHPLGGKLAVAVVAAMSVLGAFGGSLHHSIESLLGFIFY